MEFHNRFGMFIHWGIYAQTGVQEQVFARYDLPRDEYERNAAAFNPTAYDPEQWVLLAKSAGMQYICFTAKHHDGFCMWDTRYTDYNIMHTPYGKDVLRMLADACQKHGMKLSIYYSNPDWHDEYGYNPASTHQWKARRDVAPDTEKLRAYITNQITELLTNYGKIDILWFDFSYSGNKPEPGKEWMKGKGKDDWEAEELIAAVESRDQLIQQIIEYIASTQRPHLLSGQPLQPMTMSDLAQALRVNVSTISRAIREKYILLDTKVILLRSLFSARLETSSGMAVSAEYAKMQVKRIIDAEDKAAPLSDQAISEAMQGMGVPLSRRTVASYRSQMGIPCTQKRKILK